MSGSESRICTVRNATERDLLGLLQLLSRSDEGLRPAVASASELEATTWTTMLETQNLTTYVAELNRKIVGTAVFLQMPNLGYDCQPSGFIEAMAVAARRHATDGAHAFYRSIGFEAEAEGFRLYLNSG